ncbi:MAG: DUF6048 family protein [Prevotella sp.]
MMRYLFLFLLSLVVTSGKAQDVTQPATAVTAAPDSTAATPAAPSSAPTTSKRHHKRFFEGLSLGVDVVGIVMDRVTYKGEYQAFLQANIRGVYLPVVELGYGTADKKDDDTGVLYNTKAPFGRVGCDFNILRNKHDDYRLTVGLRYGLTSFDYDTSSPLGDEETEAMTYDIVTEKMTLQWAEFVIGVDAKIAGPLHMGWSLRLRRKLSASDCEKPAIYAPGYGDATQGSRFMVLYNISLEI